MQPWRQDLEAYKRAIDGHLDGNIALKYAVFFRDFFKMEALGRYEWTDIQRLGDHLHCFQSMALARARGLGKPNHDIEHYRRSLTYLAHGDEDIATRIDRFESDPQYKLLGFGKSAVSEICAYLFADRVFMRNSRDLWAAERFNLIPKYPKGTTFGRKLLIFAEAMQPLVQDYLAIVGHRTDLPINLEVDQFFSHLYEREKVTASPDPSPSEKNYWAIGTGHDGALWPDFAAGGFVAVGFDDLGDLRSYTDRETIAGALRGQDGSEGSRKNDSLAAWQFTREMKPGDVVIAKQGFRRILGVGEVTTDYRFEADRRPYQHLRSVRWLTTGDWQLPESRGVATKTLTKVTRYDAWVDLVLTTTGVKASPQPPPGPTTDHGSLSIYTVADALEDIFIAENDFREMLAQLELKQNVVLQGPPGVGKTYIARRLAYVLMGEKDPARVEVVQFHQSYSYEDFVQGLRPDTEGRFRLQDGLFYRFCQRAAEDEDRPYVFIIDEINRGNLSRIFGELMMLLEADKRSPAWAVALTYGADAEKFHVPANVYLIGTMNTADRSLAMVDYALRRRFSFVTLEPAFDTNSFRSYLERSGVPESLIKKIDRRLSRLNEVIAADTKNLGPGFRIGHSYFCPREGDEPTEDWYRRVVKYEIVPLLSEYWFDDDGKVNQKCDELLAP